MDSILLEATLSLQKFSFFIRQFSMHGIVAASAWHRRDSPVEVMRVQAVGMQWAVVPRAVAVGDLQAL